MNEVHKRNDAMYQAMGMEVRIDEKGRRWKRKGFTAVSDMLTAGFLDLSFR